MFEEDIQQLRLDQQLCFAIYSTMHAVNKAYAPMLERIGLTYPQYLAMLVLWETEGLMVKEIGDRLYLDSGTLTPLLKRLEALGLVHRIRDGKDQRQVRIVLTEQGRALRQDCKSIPFELASSMGLSIENLTGLKEDLLRLRQTLLEGRQK
ncbi:MAG TPA: MarR family transcriptional regulator [Beijerinckia sp.]|jgi:DNA-binding MarR family transcriptional regulator|nr:MarR family transcriptional regulator [Beijerinckia sp.]